MVGGSCELLPKTNALSEAVALLALGEEVAAKAAIAVARKALGVHLVDVKCEIS